MERCSLGVPQLQLRQCRPRNAIQRREPDHPVPRGKFSATTGVVSFARCGREPFCPRIGNGFAGAWRWNGSAGISAEESHRHEADCRVQGGCREFCWGSVKSTPERGFGIAGGTDKGGYVATCAEVTIDPATKKVRIRRVVQAWESGAIVNPDGLLNQNSGAIVQGIGGALFEQVLFADGRILISRSHSTGCRGSATHRRSMLCCSIARIFLQRAQAKPASWAWRPRWGTRSLPLRECGCGVCPWRRKLWHRGNRSLQCER